MVESTTDELSDYAAQMRAKADAFFARAGKDQIEVYRIEKFEPVMMDKEYHGKFFDGDSYVVVKNND